MEMDEINNLKKIYDKVSKNDGYREVNPDELWADYHTVLGCSVSDLVFVSNILDNDLKEAVILLEVYKKYMYGTKLDKQINKIRKTIYYKKQGILKQQILFILNKKITDFNIYNLDINISNQNAYMLFLLAITIGIKKTFELLKKDNKQILTEISKICQNLQSESSYHEKDTEPYPIDIKYEAVINSIKQHV